MTADQRRVLVQVREYLESMGRGVAAQQELENPFTRYITRSDVWDLALRRASVRYMVARDALNALTVAELDALLAEATP